MQTFTATARPLNSNQQFVTIQHNAQSLRNARTAFAALYELASPVRKSTASNSQAMSVETAYPHLF